MFFRPLLQICFLLDSWMLCTCFKIVTNSYIFCCTITWRMLQDFPGIRYKFVFSSNFGCCIRVSKLSRTCRSFVAQSHGECCSVFYAFATNLFSAPLLDVAYVFKMVTNSYIFCCTITWQMLQRFLGICYKFVFSLIFGYCIRVYKV